MQRTGGDSTNFWRFSPLERFLLLNFIYPLPPAANASRWAPISKLYGQKGTIMNSRVLLKLYLIISGGVFFLVGIFHFLRIIYQWPIAVGSTTIPFLLSYAGLPEAIVASLLAFWLLRKAVK